MEGTQAEIWVEWMPCVSKSPLKVGLGLGFSEGKSHDVSCSAISCLATVS